MEKLLEELLEEQKKTNELLQVIVSNKEQVFRVSQSCRKSTQESCLSEQIKTEC